MKRPPPILPSVVSSSACETRFFVIPYDSMDNGFLPEITLNRGPVLDAKSA